MLEDPVSDGLWWCGEGGGTGRMGSFEDPVGLVCVCDYLVLPFYLDVAGDFFEEGWAGEVVDVEFGFGRHGWWGCWRGWGEVVEH